MAAVVDKDGCNILAGLLVRHGVKTAILSPGSRNAPIVVSLARNKEIETRVVVDERSAAFIALGIAEITGQPVAVVCTSGTALLNYAPAVAEAYYKHLPLIVISADRPAEWIDQDDSQTLRQPGALTNFVKKTYALKAECAGETEVWWLNREINDALITACGDCRGPVHINMSVDEPLTPMTAVLRHNDERFIAVTRPREDASLGEIRWLASQLGAPRKVMVVAGFMPPDEGLNRALAKLAKMPNFVVLAENLSNLRFPDLVSCIDSVLCAIPETDIDKFRPDVVITCGGALVSRLVKRFLRQSPGLRHWHIGHNEHTVDCFQSLERRILMKPGSFFSQLSSAVQAHKSFDVYGAMWKRLRQNSASSHDEFISSAPWCDLTAFARIYPLIPKGWNLQLSNGTSIRYSQLFSSAKIARYDCNRGVSGIDGSTSTAIGASFAYQGVTLLITGDMSAQYDVGALASNLISPNFKMVVFCNGGGAIFRFIGSTSSLPELNEYFACGANLPLDKLCEGYGFSFFEVSESDDLESVFSDFASEKSHPALLAIHTDGLLSAEVLKQYFNRNKSTKLRP